MCLTRRPSLSDDPGGLKSQNNEKMQKLSRMNIGRHVASVNFISFRSYKGEQSRGPRQKNEMFGSYYAS